MHGRDCKIVSSIYMSNARALSVALTCCIVLCVLLFCIDFIFVMTT